MPHPKSLILPLLTWCVFAVAVLSGLPDKIGGEYLDRTLTRALTTYALARGLNGAISVAQGTEFSVEPLGIGFSLKPGEILDPVNDLVEQVSTVLLISATSVGLQKILLQICSSYLFTGLALLIPLAWLFSKGKVSERTGSLLKNLSVAFILLRLSIPLAALACDTVYRNFLLLQYAEASAGLEAAKVEVSKISSAPAPASNGVTEEGIFDKALGAVQNSVKGVTQSYDWIKARAEEYRRIAENSMTYLINLVLVFVFETIVTPLLFLFALRGSGRLLLRNNKL